MTENNLQYKINFHKEAKSQTNEYLKLAFIEKSFCVTCENLGPFSETLPGAYKFNNLPLHIIKKQIQHKRPRGPKQSVHFLSTIHFFSKIRLSRNTTREQAILDMLSITSEILVALKNNGNFIYFQSDTLEKMFPAIPLSCNSAVEQQKFYLLSLSSTRKNVSRNSTAKQRKFYLLSISSTRENVSRNSAAEQRKFDLLSISFTRENVSRNFAVL